MAAGFFTAVSLAGFLPAIGISISFWPGAAFFDFLAGFFDADLVGVGDFDAADPVSDRSTEGGAAVTDNDPYFKALQAEMADKGFLVTSSEALVN